MRISDWSSDVCSSDLFAAQLATLGLKRGLAGELARPKRPHTHVVYDAMLITMIASVIAAAVLFAFPQALFSNSSVKGMDRLLQLILLAVAGSDVALASCHSRTYIAATVGARSHVETLE